MNFLEQIIQKGIYLELRWKQINLSGPDAIDFLERQCTQSINELTCNDFKLNSLLGNDGRIESFFLTTIANKRVTIYVPEFILDKTIERIERFHVSEDFELETTSENTQYLYFGPDMLNDSKVGEFWGLGCELTLSPPKCEKLKTEEEILFLSLLGFDPKELLGKLITSTLLSNYALNLEKGCFPGQEPISKIINNRGAAFYPAVLETSNDLSSHSDLKYLEQVTVKRLQKFQYLGKQYFNVEMFRDFRVNKKKWIFNSLPEVEGHCHYYPMISLNSKDFAEALYQKAIEVSLNEDQNSSAINLLQKALIFNPCHLDALEIIGVLYANKESYIEAIDWMKKLSQVDSSSIMAHTNMSLYYMKINEIDLAEKHKEEATFLSFKNQAPQEDIIKEEQARKMAMFKQVLTIDAEDTLANIGLGKIFYEQGEYISAKNHLEKVLSVDPLYSQAYLILAKTLISLEKKNDAKLVIEKGIPIATKKGELMPANEMESLLRKLISL